MLRAWGQGWAQDSGQEERLSWQGGGTAASVSDRAAPGVTPDFSSQNIPAACRRRAGGIKICKHVSGSGLEPFLLHGAFHHFGTDSLFSLYSVPVINFGKL